MNFLMILNLRARILSPSQEIETHVAGWLKKAAQEKMEKRTV